MQPQNSKNALTKTWIYREERGNTFLKGLMQKSCASYLIDVLQVSYNIKVQFNKVAQNSVHLQGDWAVPGTLCYVYEMTVI